MKTFFKLTTILLVFNIILGLFYLYYYLPREQKNLRFVGETVVDAFLKNPRLLYISSYGLSVDEAKYCNTKKINNKECQKKLNEYKKLMHIIPEDIEFVLCDNKWIIQKKNYYVEVSVLSRGKLGESGIYYRDNNYGWLNYYVNRDKFNDAGSCYPWNDLPDYWKRYGKATPEEIQAVINKN